MMIYTIIGWLGPLISAGLFWGLYRKAGLRGGIMVLAFLPILGMVLQTLANVVLGVAGFGDPVSYFAVTALFNIALGLIPVVVLLMVDWPGRGQDDVFR